ncbi:hypothetical protein [Lactococcus petauri]|uniref:hypothetical protein n=1 Tax=Lactococcus petauri TaxID=1940789 RepID=UPI0022DF3CEA|nr:hypothetical protein [Lactococcus petauri]
MSETKSHFNKILKAVSLLLISVFLLNIVAPAVQAGSSDPFTELGKVSQAQLNDISEKIMEHSTLDSETGLYILNHTIVEEGIITEQQYNEVKEVEKRIDEEFSGSGKQQRLASLVVAAIAAIKAAAIFIGAAVANQLISYVTNWGVSKFCKNYRNKHSLIKSFCAANGF